MRLRHSILPCLRLLVTRMKPCNDELQQDITDLENGVRNIRIVHSSKLSISEMIPDVLYNIFTLAVCSSGPHMTTALAISHVCSHWRNCALEWPVLWTFINLNATPRLVDLFVSRSGSAPITLSLTEWTPHLSMRHGVPIVDPNRILPRLCSLTLHLSHSDLAQVQHLFQNSKISPLRLRHLDVSMERSTRSYPPLVDFLCIDLSCLRELNLERTNLPWHELPHRGLTHFNLLCPTNPPNLSQLLGFLASCPLLYELKLYISGHCDEKVDITADITTSMTKLDFPNLTRLKSLDTSSYIYIRELSARIQIGVSLSEFYLHYHNNRVHPYRQNLKFEREPTKFNIFDTVPSRVLSHFIGHHYLYIGINFYCGFFDISSAPGYTHTHPLRIVGTFPPRIGSFDHLIPILDFIRDMPEVTYLALRCQTLELPCITDMPKFFPCLDTLELDSSCSVLNLLPTNLKLQRLILTGTMSDLVSADNLLDVVSRTGIKSLELRNIKCNEEAADRIVETALRRLRKSKVTVIRSD